MFAEVTKPLSISIPIHLDSSKISKGGLLIFRMVGTEEKYYADGEDAFAMKKTLSKDNFIDILPRIERNL